MARLQVTTNSWERTKGLLGRTGLDPEEGLLIEGCAAIHTVGMSFPIDAVFLDRNFSIAKLVTELRPWRLAFCIRAGHVLELAAGGCARLGLVAGMRLRLEPSPAVP